MFGGTHFNILFSKKYAIMYITQKIIVTLIKLLKDEVSYKKPLAQIGPYPIQVIFSLKNACFSTSG